MADGEGGEGGEGGEDVADAEDAVKREGEGVQRLRKMIARSGWT